MAQDYLPFAVIQIYMNSINWPEDATYTIVESVIDLVSRLFNIINSVVRYIYCAVCL